MLCPSADTAIDMTAVNVIGRFSLPKYWANFKMNLFN